MFLHGERPEMLRAASRYRVRCIIAEEKKARSNLPTGPPHSRRRVASQKDEIGRKNPERPPYIEPLQVKRSGLLKFRQQKPGDQQATEAEEDVHAEGAIAPDAHLVGGLRLV